MVLLAASGPVGAQDFSSQFTSHSFIPATFPTPLPGDSIIYPDPKKVLHRSFILPGWGQVTNKQAWKVPIIYGTMAGLGYYSVFLTKQYHDYRAAYYNLQYPGGDLKFGATPAYLAGASEGELLDGRNFLRNRRDFIYITIGLAYLLNAIDAYVFAHLRSFDVSDDLTMNAAIKPGTVYFASAGEIPSITLTFSILK